MAYPNPHHIKMKNLTQIIKYFNTLNQDQNHFTNSNDICTPIECIKEMVDSIPNEFWQQKNLKILDTCCGNGNFHAYIATKTNINNLYFNEINPKRIENLINYFGNNINLTIQDFLTYPNTETYDLVVANPPYAKFNDGKRVSKNHNLSRDFIHKALKITKPNGYILFIVPNNWMSFADRNTLPQILSQYQFIHLDIHGAKKWFPKVGSSFTWFLLQKKNNTTAFTIHNHYILNDLQTASLTPSTPFIPLYYSEIVKNILQKTIYNPDLPRYNIQTTSYLHRFTKKKFINEQPSPEFQHKLIHTPTQTLWSKIPHKYQNGFKVFISLSNQYSTFIDDCGMTQSIAFICCDTLLQAQQIKTELDNPIYKCLNNLTRYGNFNNIRILQKFPLLNSFTLTPEELHFVNTFNQKYYGKKEKYQKNKRLYPKINPLFFNYPQKIQ